MKRMALILLLVFTACHTETTVVGSVGHHTEEISVTDCCADVEGYVCYFGPTEYNHAELLRLSSDSASWLQVPLTFVPGEGVQLECQKDDVYRLTWN